MLLSARSGFVSLSIRGKLDGRSRVFGERCLSAPACRTALRRQCPGDVPLDVEKREAGERLRTYAVRLNFSRRLKQSLRNETSPSFARPIDTLFSRRRGRGTSRPERIAYGQPDAHCSGAQFTARMRTEMRRMDFGRRRHRFGHRRAAPQNCQFAWRPEIANPYSLAGRAGISGDAHGISHKGART
jgi:hypothetical protein